MSSEPILLVPISSVTKLIYRYPSFYGMEKFKSGVAVVRGEHILDSGELSVEWENYWFVSREYSEQHLKTVLEKDDVVMSVRGTVGTFGRVQNSHVGAQISPNLIRLSPDPRKIYPPFFYYSLRGQAVVEHIAGTVASSAVPALKASDIKAAKIFLPSKAAQVFAAEILVALDDRITLLRETNATLEAIAQALFKSWFVDFDPVRAKMEGRAPDGMDEATAALFPDGLEESELGLVPRGWEVRPLDEVANFLNGLALQKFPPTDDSWLPVIKIAQLRKGDTVGADRAGRNIKSEYIVQNGDVLFSWSGSLEVEVWCGGEGALNQHLFKVTSNEYPKWFYYLWTKHYLEYFRQIAASKATTMGHIQRAHLSQAKVVAPPDSFIAAAGEYFAPLLDQWISTTLQAQTLATLRDTLLPRLISGQLRLPEALEQVEDAAVAG